MIELEGQPGSALMPEPEYPYVRVTNDLRHRIRSGEFPPGTQLPSRKQLCIEYKVSDIVIGTVMRTLRAEGLVAPLPGVGTFVADPLPPEQA